MPVSPAVSPVSLPVSPVALCLPGLLFFPGLFVVARRALAAIAGCPQGRATVLAARLVSSVQAVMASTAGYIISSSCHQHVIDDQHWLAAAYPPFAVPYFVYDVYAMYLCHRQRAQVKGHGPAPPARAAAAAFLRQELLMVLHHAAMVLVCFPVATLWRQGKGDFFLGCLLMAELSTPFVCLGKVLILYRRQHTALHKLNGLALLLTFLTCRVLLTTYRRQHTALHKLNGLALLLTFLTCRVLLFPYLYWAYGRHRGVSILKVPWVLPPAYNAAAAAMAAPQLYWFWLICRGAWRLFRTSPAPGTTGAPMGAAAAQGAERAEEVVGEGTARPP